MIFYSDFIPFESLPVLLLFSGVSHYYWAEFPVSLSNHVGTTPRLLIYPLGSVTHQWHRNIQRHSPLSRRGSPIWKLVELKMLDFIDRTRTGISILRSAVDLFIFGLEGPWGQPQGPNFPSPWATMLALRLDCSTAALTIPQKVLSLWRLVELKMLDFSDHTRTGISILTSAADCRWPLTFLILWEMWIPSIHEASCLATFFVL